MMFRRSGVFTPALCALVLSIGCGPENQVDGPAGGFALTLGLVGDGDVDEVSYVISGGSTLTEGTIDTSVPGSTASLEVFGLPPADDYVVEMFATSNDGSTTCRGEEAFEVQADELTRLMVLLRCKHAGRAGGVRVDGQINICSELTKAIASPLQTSDDFTIELEAVATDHEEMTVEYRWTSSTGRIENPDESNTLFTCDGPGPQTITIEVSDDGFDACIDTWVFDVECVAGGEADAFVAGSPVTVSGRSPFDECDLDFDPDAVFAADSECEPWIDVDPNDSDHIAVMWQQDRYELGGGARGNMAAVSFDGGETWEVSVMPNVSLCSGGDYDRVTDPFLAFAADGSIYAASLPFDLGIVGGAVVVNRSTDGGLTWSDPVVVDEAEAPAAHDRETITADPLDACTAYTVWTIFTETLDNGVGQLVMSRTTDCGETWSPPVVLSDTDPRKIAGQLVVLPDGSLRIFAIGGSEIVVHSSNDQGDTWSEPLRVTEVRSVNPFSVGESFPIRSGSFDVAVDEASGGLYVVWEQLFTPLILPIQVAFSASYDGGLTWSAPIRVDQTPTTDTLVLDQAFLPSIAVADDGTVGVTYYNFQRADVDVPMSLTDHWFIHCNPNDRDCTNEAAWAGTAVRITPEPFDYLNAPRVQPTRRLFLGDYVGLAAGGPDFFAFFTATTDEDPANAIFVPIRRSPPPSIAALTQ